MEVRVTESEVMERLMGTFELASLSVPRPVWAADRAFVRAQRATARKRNLEAKIGARPDEPIRKRCPDLTQVFS
jgi:hypothetical protein